MIERPLASSGKQHIPPPPTPPTPRPMPTPFLPNKATDNTTLAQRATTAGNLCPQKLDQQHHFLTIWQEWMRIWCDGSGGRWRGLQAHLSLHSNTVLTFAERHCTSANAPNQTPRKETAHGSGCPNQGVLAPCLHRSDYFFFRRKQPHFPVHQRAPAGSTVIWLYNPCRTRASGVQRGDVAA